MRTVEEILKWIPAHDTDSENEPMWLKSDVMEAMKQYATEALQEAAKKINYPYRDEFGCHCDVSNIVLNIINELK